MKLPNGQYDISKIGLDKPVKFESQRPAQYNPFDYEAKYKEMLKIIVEQQKEIDLLKSREKQMQANFKILAEAINGKNNT